MITTQIVRTRSEDRRTGYSVAILFSLDFGDSFERMTHHVVFENLRDAEAMAERIKKAVRGNPVQTLNFDHWLWEPSCSSYNGRLQGQPTAHPVFRPARIDNSVNYLD
jgi:hypothetical protein